MSSFTTPSNPEALLGGPPPPEKAPQMQAGPPKGLTHCGRHPQVPGCPRTLNCRYGSCLHLASVLCAGILGPEGVRQGHPEAGGFPGSFPPGIGGCGCAGHQLEGELQGQGKH